MRKLISILLIVVMTLGIVGCQQDESNETSQNSEETKNNENEGSNDEESDLQESNTTGPTNSNPLSDARVRQAIAYAIDMDAIAEGLLESKAVPATSLTPEGAMKATGLNEYKYDPDKARELLKEADWDNNYVLDVAYYYSDQLTVDIMTAAQAYLADVGIQMKFRKLEGDLASLIWSTPDDPINGPSAVEWDMVYGAVAALSMHEYYNRFQGGVASNSHTPTDPILDELIIASNATANTAEQMRIFKEIQQYENENLPLIPLYHQQLFVYESDRVDRKGIPYGNEQFAYDWEIINWDIEADKNGEHTLYSNGGPIEFVEGPFTNPGLFMTQKMLFDRLIVADENLVPKEGQLAETFDVSDDGKTIAFTLREGLTWHDGTPLTSEDVQFSIEYYSQVPTLNAFAGTTYSKINGYQDFIDGTAEHISGIQVNGNTITIEFDELDPNALMTFSQWPPLPKHLLENSDPLQSQQDSFWQSPVGSGPFKVDEIKMGDYAVFSRYEDYWDEGTGNIEKIQLYASNPDADDSLVINAESKAVDYSYNKNVGDANAIEKLDYMTVIPVNIRYTRLFYVNKFPKE